MASYIVAASLFVIASSYLLHFVIEPPGSSTTNLEHVALRSKADDALGILVGSPGSPTVWGATTLGIDAVDRLGLIESGTTLRIDPDKFDALARGKFATESNANGGVDYAEAKRALDLEGFEFHLRAYPILSETDEDDPYGTASYSDFRVAYVGAASGASPSAAAQAEIASLNALGIGFDDEERADSPTGATGDVYLDDSGVIRSFLLPNIGASISSTVISAGAGTKYDPNRAVPSVYEELTTLNTSLTPVSTAMALTKEDLGTLGYTKNREMRAIVGSAVMTHVPNARLSWWEWVDTDRGNGTYDCGDYGYVEVSPDNGANWYALTDTSLLRSQDCSSTVPPVTPHTAAMTLRTVADVTLDCAPCANADDVLIAFHWIADNDNDIGYGWVVDDVTLDAGLAGASGRILSKTFEEPEYDMLIVGSGITNSALEPNDVKLALRDYVDKYGGRIMVTGPTSNVNWLHELFDAGTSGSSGGLAAPDTTHPLLTLPNSLNYGVYTRAQDWDFGASDDDDLFSPIVTTSGGEYVLAVSREAAWGSEEDTSEGAVILSSYIPHQMGLAEGAKFFANSVTYGRYHHLYLDVGPPIPEDGTVASLSRSATMNMYRDGSIGYTEMAFILYVWEGTTTADAEALPTDAVAPGQPRDVEAVWDPDTGEVTITWITALSDGSHEPDEFHVYRGQAPGATVRISDPDTDPVNFVPGDPTRVYSYVDTAVTEGETYYYEITLENVAAEGPPSDPASVTPIGHPGTPAAPTHPVLQTPGSITIEWAPPTDTGGGSIYGYILSVNDTDSSTSYHILAEVGSTTSYQHAVDDEHTRYYKVSALNGVGWSSNSSASAGASTLVPVAPPTLTVTRSLTANNLTLAWVAPVDLLGQTLEGFKIYRSTDGTSYSLLATLTDPANTSFEDRNLGASVTRWYQVSAVTNGGEGELSAADDATTMAVPNAPAAFTATKLPNPLTQRTLAWTASVSDATVIHYEVWMGTSSDTSHASWARVTNSALVGTTHDPATTSTRYYAVKAVSPAGTSAFSNVDS